MLQFKVVGGILKCPKIFASYLFKLIKIGSRPRHFLIESTLGASIARYVIYGPELVNHTTSGLEKNKNKKKAITSMSFKPIIFVLIFLCVSFLSAILVRDFYMKKMNILKDSMSQDLFESLKNKQYLVCKGNDKQLIDENLCVWCRITNQLDAYKCLTKFNQ